MEQTRENGVIGNLAEEIREIEKIEKVQMAESEIRTITAACMTALTIICCP